MRRPTIILAVSLLLTSLAAPAIAKPGKPDKPAPPAPTVTIGAEPHAEYQPDVGLCVADVGVTVERPSRSSVVVFEASLESEVFYSQDWTIERGGSRTELLFSYDLPCDSATDLEITHTATLFDKRGNEVASDEKTHLMEFSVHPPCDPAEPGCVG